LSPLTRVIASAQLAAPKGDIPSPNLNVSGTAIITFQ
jgi:hypothetical protein